MERIRNVRLAGPTLFGPVINKATSIAQETAARKMRKYYVLMIITVMSSYSPFTVQITCLNKLFCGEFILSKFECSTVRMVLLQICKSLSMH